MPQIKIRKNYDLTYFNTFRISAKAQFFVIVKNEAELLAAVNWAKTKKLPISILGGGSNILPVSELIKGLVVKISGEKYSVKENRMTAWAGTSLAKLVQLAELKKLSGLEWAAGIPGHLGGALRGNAGAYGRDMEELVILVKAYDLDRGAFVELKKNQCGFSYRGSIFKANGSLVAVEAVLEMKPGAKSEIKDLMQKNLSHRRLIQPKEPSAGCVFKNLKYDELKKQNKDLALELEAKGLVKGGKIGVGYLIDRLGLKGVSRGQAEISQTHANFIVNTGKAKAGDVLKLIKLVKKEIKNKYKINLEEEIQYFGG